MIPIPSGVDPLQLFIAACIPIVTGLVTKLAAHPALKALVTLLLAVAMAFFNAYTQAGGALDVRLFGMHLLVDWATAILAYYGLLKHAGDGVAPLAAATANVGIG